MSWLARIIALTFVLLALLVTEPSSVGAQGFVEFPSNLKAQWQSAGAQVNTLYPILTWDNPAGIGAASIKNIYVKVQRDAEARGCDENTIIEHVFTTDEQFNPPCNLSEKTVFARGSPPNSYIVPTGKLVNNQTYYWSVWVETTNGQLYSSTGFRSSTGGNYTTHDYFTVNLSGIDKHIWGVNVYPNSQFIARGLDSQGERFNLIDTQLDWARLATGRGGWTKVFFWGIDNSTPGALAEWRHTVEGIYEREMIPVVRLQGPWVGHPLGVGSNELGGYYAAPSSSNGYQDAAQAYKRVIADLPKTAGTPLFIEIYNEPPDPVNWGGRTDEAVLAREYARFFMAVRSAVSELGDSRIKLLSGALARCSDRSFLKRLVDIPGFAQAATADGYWAVHVYTHGNRESDPAISLDDPNLYQIDPAAGCNPSPLGYKYQLDILARAGIDARGLKVIVTEGGFRSPTAEREEEKARKVLRLYDILRGDRAHIEGVSLFALTQPIDPLDRSFLPSGPYSGYDFGYYWVEWNSGTDPVTGKPTQPLPVYNLVANTVNPGDALSQEAHAIGYTVSEDPLIVNASTSPAIVSSFPARLIYEFLDMTPGQKNLFVKYFYSNGKTVLTQTPIIFAGTSDGFPNASQRGWHYTGTNVVFEWQYHWVSAQDGHWAVFSVGETTGGTALLVINGTPSGATNYRIYPGSLIASRNGFDVNFSGSGVTYHGVEKATHDKVTVSTPDFSFSGRFVRDGKVFNHGNIQIGPGLTSPDYYSVPLKVDGEMTVNGTMVNLAGAPGENDHQYGVAGASGSLPARMQIFAGQTGSVNLYHDWIYAKTGEISLVATEIQSPAASSHFARFIVLQLPSGEIKKAHDVEFNHLEWGSNEFSKKVAISSRDLGLELLVEINRETVVLGNTMQEDGGASALLTYGGRQYSGFAVKESTIKQSNYRKATPSPTPSPRGGAPGAGCAGGITACGDSNYGNLGECRGTWSYPGNTVANFWCAANAGGVDAYCYQCNGQLVPQPGTPTPVSGPAYTTPVSDTNHCATYDGKRRKQGRETGMVCEGWVASNKSCAADLENPYYFNTCKLVDVGPTPPPLSDANHCANFEGKYMTAGKPSGITCTGWVQDNKSCAQDAENPYYFNSCTGTIGNQPPSQVVTPVGYSLSEDGVALQNESSPQVATTSFPATVGFSLSANVGVRSIFVKYYYSNGQSVSTSVSVNYRTSGAPIPDSVTPRNACPGGIAACGNESYGNLSSCDGTWSYAGNSDWNAWCLENAGGVDAYCYQCNPASYTTPGYPTPGQYSTPAGVTPVYSTPPEGQSSCSPAYNPPGLLCNSGRSDGAWSNVGCGCRNYYYTTFTGTYNGQQYTNDTSLNCQQPTHVETKSC